MPLSARGEPITLVSLIDSATGLPAGLATPSAYTLLKSATGNTGATATASNPFAADIRGGSYIWRVAGSFGGGTVTLQSLDLDGTTWANVRNQAGTADVAFTAPGSIGVVIGQGSTVRALVTGASGASLNSSLSGVA